MNKKKLKYLKSALASKKGAVFSSEIVIIILMVLVIAAIIITFIFTFINDKDKEIAEDIHSSYSELDQSNSSSDNTGNGGDEGGSLYETIPAGGVYKSGDKTYGEGDSYPTPKIGDIYSYGDYEYGYGVIKLPEIYVGSASGWLTREQFVSGFGFSEDEMVETVGWPSGVNSWSIGLKDSTKTSYGEILSSVGDKPVTFALATFLGSQVENAPVLPDTITNASMAFYYCFNLKTVSYLPDSIIYCANMFSDCSSLKTVGNIPSNIRIANNMFYNCSSLEAVPPLGDNIKIMTGFCQNCTSLKQAPEIPDGVTNIYYAFKGCTSLVQPPSLIPSSVNDMESAFEGCSNLTGTITIDATPSSYSHCFYGVTKQITLNGSSSMLYDIALTGGSHVIVEK